MKGYGSPTEKSDDVTGASPCLFPATAGRLTCLDYETRCTCLSLLTYRSFNVICGIRNGRFQSTTFLYICIFFAIKRFFTTERCLKCRGVPFESCVNSRVLIICIFNVGCHTVSTDRSVTSHEASLPVIVYE